MAESPYRSPHGIEQDRRDFMRDHPNLYLYIARREASKALDAVGDIISGHHEAANVVWHRAAVLRQGYEAMQTPGNGH